jgi:murein DD-endopeptidase MepM/ murein hydrolase activator NlpD
MKLFLLTSVILGVAFVYTEQVHIPEAARLAAHHIMLPFKIAALYTNEADRLIAVPVEGVHASEVKNTWHAPIAGRRLHEGQDIFAERGTAVRSATEGYVVQIGENELGGRTVFVMGRGGRRYYYAHLDAYASDLAVGDYVTPERIIGYVGTSGNAAGTPPHLHFGIYTSKGSINPRPLMKNID